MRQNPNEKALEMPINHVVLRFLQRAGVLPTFNHPLPSLLLEDIVQKHVKPIAPAFKKWNKQSLSIIQTPLF